jgi:gliding motility-associated-like protein/uncharacterized repeat protein (TIGR01451 family)
MKKIVLLFVFLLANYVGVAQSNIEVTNTNSQTQYVPGSVVTYAATVTNLGPNTATNVLVTSIASVGITGPSWSGPGVSGGAGDINHTIPSLAVGQVVNFTITFTVPVAFTASLNCRVEAFLAGDPNTLNNWVNDMDSRATKADVSITNTNNQTGYAAGSTVTYTVTVQNSGLLASQGVAVSGIIPAGVSNYTWSGNGIIGSTTALANTIGTLAVGQIITYSVTFLIPATYTGNLVHQVSVAATTPDNNLSNNTATDTDPLFVGADLVVVNTDGQTIYQPGTQRTYTITVSNNGPTPAANVVVTYTIPAAITSYTWTGTNMSSGSSTPLNNTIPSLAVGASVTYTFIMDIPVTFTGNLTTTAGVTSTTIDLVPGCSQCVDTNTMVNVANLQVTNTNNQLAYITGGTSIYTVRVTNLGPQNTTNVLVTNPIPAGITSFNWNGTNGSSGINVPINNTILSLVAGQTVTYTITMQIPATLTGDLSSVATASSAVFDTNLANNTATDTDILGVGADIVVTNTDNLIYHTVGGSSGYTITVKNNGPFDAVNVLVTNPLPDGIVNATWTGNATSGIGALSNVIPLLTVGSSVVYTFTVQIPTTQTTSVVSTTSVTSDTFDPNPACALCIDTSLSPINIANITITNTDASTTYTAGQNRVYIVNVRNIGPSTAENITVTGSLTAGIDPTTVSWTGNNGTFGSGNVSATILSLNINTSVIYTVTVPVPPSFSQTTNLVHTITYTSSTIDPAPACPNCADTDTPAPLANIIVSKTNNTTEYVRGENAVYTITVQNDGPSDALNVVVNDPLPANITQMSWTSSLGGIGTGSLNQTIPVLALNSVVTFTVTVRVPASFPAGNLINTVTVSSGTNDPIPANNTATDSDVPAPSFVKVDTTTYTPTQLIRDVLINEPCVVLSNFSASSPNSFGYFNRKNADFPLKEGIIIRSGEAQRTQGIYVPETNAANSHSSIGSGIGDADLNNILTAQGFSANTVDAAFVSFDFTPTIENFSFRFLFASEEYGAQQCATPGAGFVDAFAFILTNLNTGISQNLAIVPGTTTLISAPTIRRATYFTGSGANCGDLNPQFFGRYNRSAIGPNPSGPTGSAINLAGQTLALRAEATVTPNTPYRIKLVVSDVGNTDLDSAVLLEAGSFNIGGPRITGSGLLVENTSFTGSDAPCAGVALTIQSGLAPTPGITYTWLKDGEVIDSAINYNLVVNTAGTYTVVFTYPSGCVLQDDIVIEYIPQTFPLMEDADDLFECNDGSPFFDLTLNEPVVITLYDSTEFNTFYYTTLEAAQSASGVPLTDAEKVAYPGVNGQEIWMKMVNFFEGGFCDPIRSFKLFLFAPPAATIATSTVICSGTVGGLEIQGTPLAIVSYTKNGVAQDDITLSATGTYTIDPGVQTVIITTTNTYVLTNVESDATPPCSIAVAGQTATVTINALPIASFSASNNIICQGTSATLNFTGTPNATITYTDGTTSYTTVLDAAGIAPVLTASLATTTTFTLTNAAVISSGVPCSQNITGTVIITVNQNPQITAIIADDTVCFGTSKTFAVAATGTGLTYQWYYNGTTLITGATNATYTINAVTSLDAGNYSVVVSGICGSPVTSNNASLSVVPPTIITLQPATSQTVCTGETVNFTIAATGASFLTYQWFKEAVSIPGATTPVFTINSTVLADSGNYSCQITSGICGTVTSNSAQLTVNQGPVVMSQSGNEEICVDKLATFSVFASGTNLTYQWFKGLTAILGATSSTYSILNTTQADSGTYYCDIANLSCPNIQSIAVTLVVNPLPIATILPQGTPAAICAGQSSQISFSGTPGAVVIYTINGGTPETVILNPAGGLTLLNTGSLNETVVYELVRVTYTGTDSCFQDLTGSATVIVTPLPVVTLEDGFICIDPVTFATTRPYLLNTGLNTADYTFEWFDVNGLISGVSNSFYEVSAVGPYSVTITDIISGCQASAFVNVDESKPPTDFDYTVSGFFEGNPTVVITTTPAGDFEYQLDFGPFQESNIFDNLEGGTHTITVRDPEVCDALTKDILVIDFPKYFTPNGDGINDTWNIPSIKAISMTKIYIFDRFGKLVKEISTSGSGWDGTYSGQLLPATDYWFTISYQEAGINKEFRSHFSLKR